MRKQTWKKQERGKERKYRKDGQGRKGICRARAVPSKASAELTAEAEDGELNLKEDA